MNLLLLTSNIGLFGAEGVILNLIKSLPASVNPVLGNFYNQHNPHSELAEIVGASGYSVKQINCSGAFDPLTISRISKVIKEEKIDLIHSHGYKSDIYGFIAAKINSVPIISTLHSLSWKSAKLGLYVKIQQFVYRYFNYVACVSGLLLEELAKTPLSPENFGVIDNGIDVENFSRKPPAKKALAKQYNLPQDGIFIGAAGRLSHEKGFDLLIEAACEITSKNPTVYFLIAGEGPQESELKTLVDDLGLTERVKFLGLTNDMVGFFSSLDLFVLPSRSEGLPLVILEAMAAGLPIVATEVGAVSRAVQDGQTGFLVPPGEPQALALAQENLLSHPDKARQMGQNAFNYVKDNFSAQAMAQNYYQVYQSVLSEGKKVD